MSMFDVALICMMCWEAEQAHPRYEHARTVETEAVKKGDLNFKGIGFPSGKMKKRCWIVVGDVVESKADKNRHGAVTSVSAGAFATWIEVLWNDGSTSSVPIETVEIVEETS
jgi:hypothetical protein